MTGTPPNEMASGAVLPPAGLQHGESGVWRERRGLRKRLAERVGSFLTFVTPAKPGSKSKELARLDTGFRRYDGHRKCNDVLDALYQADGGAERSGWPAPMECRPSRITAVEEALSRKGR